MSPSPTNLAIASDTDLCLHLAKTISVFAYEDYHLFLRDWVASKKRERSSFSYQELADRIGLKSKSSLRLVCMGERDLSPSAAVKFVVAMALNERETEYFLALVAFNNATDPRERDLHLQQMRKVPKPINKTILSAQEFDFFSKWYVVAIWEMVAARPFGGDFKVLGNMLDPPISPEEARHALMVLLDLDLIEPLGDKYCQKQAVLHTRDELKSLAIKTYQRETMLLAADALDRVDPARRQITTLTMGLDEERWNAVRALTQEYRQKLIELGSRDGAVDRVYQVNIQVFPLTSPVPPQGD